MAKVIVFGNSASGKSTYAKRLKNEDGLAHLDLDEIAWLPTSPPTRQILEVSRKQIMTFVDTHEDWVIEGCYADLIAMVAPFSDELIYMDLPVELCIKNTQARPWEPHKYESKAAQDANLPMLIDWIKQYDKRTDEFSKQAHCTLFDTYQGKKTRLNANSTR